MKRYVMLIGLRVLEINEVMGKFPLMEIDF